MTLRARLLTGMAAIAIVLAVAAVFITRTTEQHLVAQVDAQLERADVPRPRGPRADDGDRLSSVYVGYFTDGELVTLAEPNLRGADDPAPPTITLAEARAGAEVSLSPTEYNLLRFLLTNKGRVMSKAQILDHVWQYDFGGDAGVVESYVSYLRKKIDTTEPRLLHTLRGVGYSLRLPRT